MSTQRKQYSAEFKARVALEALKGLKTVNELASTYGVHPTQIAHWKHRLQKELPDIFSVRRDKRERDQEAFQAQLYQQIGQLKKISAERGVCCLDLHVGVVKAPVGNRRAKIDADNSAFSVLSGTTLP